MPICNPACARSFFAIGCTSVRNTKGDCAIGDRKSYASKPGVGLEFRKRGTVRAKGGGFRSGSLPCQQITATRKVQRAVTRHEQIARSTARYGDGTIAEDAHGVNVRSVTIEAVKLRCMSVSSGT